MDILCGHKETVFPVLDQLQSGITPVRGDHTQAEGHGFVDHKTPDVLPGGQHKGICRNVVALQGFLFLKGDKVDTGQVVFPGEGQVLLGGGAADDVDADALVHAVGGLEQQINTLAGDKLADGQQHLLFPDAQLPPDGVLFLPAGAPGENIRFPQGGEPIPPDTLGLCPVVQVVFVQLPAGGEIHGGPTDGLGLDELLEAAARAGEGPVRLQAVGNPPKLAPGDGQQLRRGGVAGDHNGIPILLQPGDHPGAQGFVNRGGPALQVDLGIAGVRLSGPFFVPLGGAVELI